MSEFENLKNDAEQFMQHDQGGQQDQYGQGQGGQDQGGQGGYGQQDQGGQDQGGYGQDQGEGG